METAKERKARLAQHDKIVARAEELIRELAPRIIAEFDLPEDEGMYYVEFACMGFVAPYI